LAKCQPKIGYFWGKLAKSCREARITPKLVLEENQKTSLFVAMRRIIDRFKRFKSSKN
jgi:hypothetical protein